ncbi:MAG: hypothetical protein ACI8ZM_005641 [Crocinitomix sp.]|jgi:hypothetical protein
MKLAMALCRKSVLVFVVLNLMLLLLAFSVNAQVRQTEPFLSVGSRSYQTSSLFHKTTPLSKLTTLSPSLSIGLTRKVNNSNFFGVVKAELSVFSYGYQLNFDVPEGTKYYYQDGIHADVERVYISQLNKMFGLKLGYINKVSQTKRMLFYSGLNLHLFKPFGSLSRYWYNTDDDPEAHLGVAYAVERNSNKAFIDLSLGSEFSYMVKKRWHGVGIEANISSTVIGNAEYAIDLAPVAEHGFLSYKNNYFKIYYKLYLLKNSGAP